VPPSFKLATEKVKLKPVAWIRARDVQVAKVDAKFAAGVTAPKLKAGIEDRAEQLLNIDMAFVTAAVFIKGTVWRIEQP